MRFELQRETAPVTIVSGKNYCPSFFSPGKPIFVETRAAFWIISIAKKCKKKKKKKGRRKGGKEREREIKNRWKLNIRNPRHRNYTGKMDENIKYLRNARFWISNCEWKNIRPRKYPTARYKSLNRKNALVNLCQPVGKNAMPLSDGIFYSYNFFSPSPQYLFLSIVFFLSLLLSFPLLFYSIILIFARKQRRRPFTLCQRRTIARKK